MVTANQVTADAIRTAKTGVGLRRRSSIVFRQGPLSLPLPPAAPV